MSDSGERVKVQFLEDVAQVIRDVDLWILRMQNGIASTVARVLSGEGNFRDYVNLAFITTITLISSYILGSKALWAQYTTQWFAQVVGAIATFMDKIGIRIITSVHMILMLVWEDYREIFTGIAQASAAISQRLGMGAAFLSNLFANAEAVWVNGAIMVGASADEAKIDFLGVAASWLNKLSNRFTIYAKNPGMILQDFNQYIALNAQRNIDRGFGQLSYGIEVLRDTVTGTVERLFNLTDSFNTLVAGLPGNVQEAIEGWWGPINDELYGWREEVWTPTMERIEDVIEVLQREANNDRNRLEMLAERGNSAAAALLADWAAAEGEVLGGINLFVRIGRKIGEVLTLWQRRAYAEGFDPRGPVGNIEPAVSALPPADDLDFTVLHAEPRPIAPDDERIRDIEPDIEGDGYILVSNRVAVWLTE